MEKDAGKDDIVIIHDSARPLVSNELISECINACEGHKFSGTVAEACDASGKPWIGKRVGVFSLIPCCRCPSCVKRQYEMCSQYDYLVSRRDGGFAEYVRKERIVSDFEEMIV